MPTTVLTGPTIAAGQSLSSSLDVTAGFPALIMMPAAWTDAQLTFLASIDGATFSDLFTASGGELIANVIPGGTALMLDEAKMRGLLYLKFRSGTRAAPIVQEEQRNFIVVVERA